MKLSVLFLAAVALPGYAQIPRGTTYAGVGMSNAFTESRSNHRIDYSGYGFALQPCFGWFVIDNLSVGLQVDGYAGSISAKSSELNANTYSLGGSLFVRDYIPIKGTFYALFALDYGWQRGRTDYRDADMVRVLSPAGYPTVNGSYASAANTFGVRIGASWFMTQRLTLETTVGYTRRNHRDLDTHSHIPFTGGAMEISLRRWLVRG